MLCLFVYAACGESRHASAKSGTLSGVEATEALEQFGGVATRGQLLGRVTRASLDAAVRTGDVLVVARDRYVLASVDEAVAIAAAVSGVLSHTSAALHHGWAVKEVPDKPHVAVRRKRNLRPEQRRRVHAHYQDLMPDDVAGIATSKELTLQQCLRLLPFDAALAVADSALRADDVAALRRAAATARGPGSSKVRRVARLARKESANPFESVLRAIALDVDGLHVAPQRLITDVEPWVCPDLVDTELRIVLEADSFEWHGDRAALRNDARRYDRLVAAGWLVLRFAWEDVMFDPDFVRDVLVRTVARVREQAQRHCACCLAA